MLKTRSRLTQKIFRKFLFLYTLIFGILAAVILSASWVLMLRSTRNTLSSRVSLIMDSWNTFYSIVQEKRYDILSSTELNSLLEKYERNGSASEKQEINLLLSNMQTADSSLMFLILESEDGALFHSLNHSGDNILSFIREKPEYKALWNTNSSYISPVLTGGFESISSPFSYYLTEQNISGKRYMISICYDAQILGRNFDRAAEELSNAHLISGEGMPLYSKEAEEDVSLYSIFTDTQGMSGTKWTSRGYTYYLQSSHSMTLAAGYFSYWHIFRVFNVLFIGLLAAYLIPMSIALFYLARVNDQYLSPMQELSMYVEQYQLDGDPIQICETGDEIEDLSKALHFMSKNIMEQSARLAQNEREQAIAEYRLLTTQMNPHFIYNTMNIINILARKGDAENIINVNTALTKIIREQLNTKRLLWEEVEKEVEFLKQYQIIMDYRYKNQVEVEFEIDPTVRHCYIPKNILQPLMENAYYHGLSSEYEEMRGHISLYIYPVEEELVIELSDDGNGFSEERLEEVRGHFLHPKAESEMQNHIGMTNIYRRLEHLYGEHFIMDIQSEEGEGTMIAITIPLLQKAPENGLSQ